jgi:hypothetical protein
VDRVDAWLNGQVGWRRGALIWLLACLPCVDVGCGIWALFTPGTAGLGTGFLEVVGWSFLAAVPFAGLVAAAQRRRVARGSGMPFFSWRFIVSLLCIVSAVLPAELTDQQPYWHRIHREVGLWQMVLLLAAMVFLLLAVRWNHRFRGGDAHDPLFDSKSP